MSRTDVTERLADWLRTQLPDADDVRVEGLDRVEFGHSAEMMVLTVVTQRAATEARQDVVLRLRPPPPALLEPYDLKRQFDVLRALEHTAVRVPRALWLEDSGEVLGREFLVMERVAGDVYEMETPDRPATGIRRMCASMAEQLGAIHSIELAAVDLSFLGDGRDHPTANSTTGPTRCTVSNAGRCPRYVRPNRSHPRSSPWSTVMPSLATLRSAAMTSVRYSIGS
jgi:aminoglycoside phosphotransferase (APT) family kinase protein